MMRPELLAPAGSMASLKAAVAAGADAVYMGGARFGARAYARSVEENDPLSCLDAVHFHGRKLYLTVNTLLKEKELTEELPGFLEPLYRHGLDAVIVQDYGVLRVIRENFPELPIHASTQMAVGGVYGAALLEQAGVSRIVLPRECSLEDIREISRGTGLEIETFIHGALCYCYSGQCLMSSLIGGRSGNRGRCAQPCRLTYPKDHLLNLKDLCTAELLHEILDAGSCSLKIEGRMKSPEYVAGVVSVYGAVLDSLLPDTEGGGCSGLRLNSKGRIEDLDGTEYGTPEDCLKILFNRGGFTDGYYHRKNGKDMIFKGEAPKIADPDHPFLEMIRRSCVVKEAVMNLHGNVRICPGKPAMMELSCGNVSVTVTGQEVGTAQNRPLSETEVRKQFMKTGGTGYVFASDEALRVTLEEGSFMPVGAMNALRREALQRITEERLHAYQRID